METSGEPQRTQTVVEPLEECGVRGRKIVCMARAEKI